MNISILHNFLQTIIRASYTNEECRHGGNNSSSKHQRNNLGRVLGVGAEDVVNLRELSVSQWRLALGYGSSRVALYGNVENGSN